MDTTFTTPQAEAAPPRCIVTGCVAAPLAALPMCAAHWPLVPPYWRSELPRTVAACAAARTKNLTGRARLALHRAREHALLCAQAAVEARLEAVAQKGTN
jgi:hypothetical protein